MLLGFRLELRFGFSLGFELGGEQGISDGIRRLNAEPSHAGSQVCHAKHITKNW